MINWDEAGLAWLLEPAKIACERAIAELWPIAQKGEREASIVIDAATGHRLDAQIGNRHRVGYDPTRSAGSEAVIALHVHMDESPPSSDDWDVLLLNPEVWCVVAVTPTQAYVLEKPVDWNPRRHGLPALQNDELPNITPGGLFVGYAKLLKRRRSIADATAWEDLSEDIRNAIFGEANGYLASRFGVFVRRVKLP